MVHRRSRIVYARRSVGRIFGNFTRRQCEKNYVQWIVSREKYIYRKFNRRNTTFRRIKTIITIITLPTTAVERVYKDKRFRWGNWYNNVGRSGTGALYATDRIMVSDCVYSLKRACMYPGTLRSYVRYSPHDRFTRYTCLLFTCSTVDGTCYPRKPVRPPIERQNLFFSFLNLTILK